MKACSIYFKGPRAFIFTSHTVQDGPGIEGAPMFNVAASDANELAEAIKNSIVASRTGVPAPADYRSLVRDTLKFTRERSYKQFVSNAILRDVWDDGITIKIIPCYAAGKGSFEHRVDQAIPCSRDWLDIAKRLIESVKSSAT